MLTYLMCLQVEFDEMKLRQEITYAIKNIHGVRCTISIKGCSTIFIFLIAEAISLCSYVPAFLDLDCLSPQDWPVPARHGL